MILVNKLKKSISLIFEGETFMDKVKIFFYLLGIKNDLYLKNKDGLFFIRKNSSDLWMLSTFGEDELREYFALDKGVFLDIGANVGKYSIMVGNRFKNNGEIYAFEPEQSTRKALKKNIELNGLKNIKIIPLACFDKKKKLNFYINPKNSGGHSLISKTEIKIEVSADKLDNIIKDYKIKKVDLIKIDVEGAEISVLNGAKKTIKKFHPKIVFEAWNIEQFEKCKNILNQFNYKYKKIGVQDYFAY